MVENYLKYKLRHTGAEIDDAVDKRTIVLDSAPTSETVGVVGQLVIYDGKIYECTEVTEIEGEPTTYTWNVVVDLVFSDTDKANADKLQGKSIVTTLGSGNTTIPTSGAVKTVTDKFANSFAYVETGTTATKAYVKGEYLLYQGRLCITKSAISSGTTFALNSNIEYVNVGNRLYALENTSGGAEPHVVEITSSGTWTVPDGVKEVDVFLVGGGQGGGTSQNVQYSGRHGGKGGNGGKILLAQNYKVTPNSSIPVTVGTGGAKGGTSEGAVGADGGNSTFDKLSSDMQSYQWTNEAGTNTAITQLAPFNGGVGTLCMWNQKVYGICGGNGGDMGKAGQSITLTDFGISKTGGNSVSSHGGGGASMSANGGNASSSTGGTGATANANTGGGGGGGGGYYGSYSNYARGGDGGSGIVIIRYYA